MKKNKRVYEQESLLVFREGRVVYFFDEVHSESACEAIRLIEVLECESTKKDITIIFCSCGGNCYDGMSLYDKIRSSECNIITKGTGLVASMALILFLAGDVRIITEHARLLSHQLTNDSFSGRAEDFKIEAKEIESLDAMLISIIAERTGQTESKIRRDQKAGDYWIDAEKAKEEGYVDMVIKNTRTYRRKKKSRG